MYQIKEPLKKLDNISLTGYRVIQLFLMLAEKPRSDEEINNAFENDPYLSRSVSKDTLGIYLNTLREIGCDISRPKSKNNYKHVLNKHPFKYKFTQEDAQIWISLFKSISTLNNWRLINKLFLFLEICIDKVDSESDGYIKLKEYLTNNLLFNKPDILYKVRKLELLCKKNQPLQLDYAYHKGLKKFEIIPEYILFENKKFYLCCISQDYDDQLNLRIDRIKNFNKINKPNYQIEKKSTNITFSITGDLRSCYHLSPEDKIISKSDNELIIKANIKNKFKFFQRILSYGSECTIIEPSEIKSLFTAKLEQMLKIYD